MSGKKISELPILPPSRLDQVSDTVVIVDDSANETKRMRIGDMITSVVNPLIGDKLNNVNDYIQNNLPDLTPPPTPTGFVAIGGVSNINIQHDNPVYTQGHGHLETILYGVKSGSSSSTFEDAIEIARFSGKSFSYATSASTGWRLWIKWKSIDGAVSTIPAGGTNGLYVVTDNQITGIIDALTGQLNKSHLTQELNSRIDLIDGNADGSVNSRIAQEVLARNDAVLAEGNARIVADTILNNAIVSETQSRSQIDSILSNSINAGNITTSVINDNIKKQQSLIDTSITKLNQSLIAISADGTNTKSAIITETSSRNQGDLALTNQLSIAASAVNANASAIINEASTRVDQNSANASVTQSIIAQSQYGLTAISEERNVRSAVDGVLSNLQTALVSSNDQSKASIIEQSNTFLNSFSALSSKNDNLLTQTGNNTSVLNSQQKAYTDLYTSISSKTDILSTQVNSNVSAIKVEQDTRTTDALSSAGIVTQLVTQNSNNTSAISTEQLSRSTDNISIASNISTLVAKTDNNGSAILTERSIRSDANQTTGAIINNIKSGFDSVNSYIIQEANTRSSADVSTSNILTNVVSDSQNNKASIQQEALTRSDANSSAAKVIDVLKSNANNTTSAIVNESITRSLNDSSNASVISGLTSSVGSNVSAILNESTIRVNTDTAYSSQLNVLSGAVDNSNSLINSFSSTATTNYNSITAQTNNAISKLGDNIAALDSERITRVTQDQSTATQVTGLVSSNSNNNAAIQTEASTRSTANNAISSALTTVSASNNSLSSAIQTEATTRLNADQTNANLIQTVQSRLDTGDYAAVKTQASTSASDITGLKAQYTVKTDINGYVSGFGLASTANNATPTSEFTVVADKFAIAPVGSANAWNNTTNYQLNQTVYYEGNTYDCIIANSNIVPTNTTYWSKSASPFFYTTSTQVIGDTTIPPGLYVNKANISRLTADQIDTRGLSVKDSNGNIILAAGSAIDYAKLGGASANLTGLGYTGDLNATVGADSTNLKAGTGVNLVANPSLRDSISPWQTYINTGAGRTGTITQFINNNGAPAGYGSVRLSIVGSTSTTYDDSVHLYAAPIPCTPGERLELQAKVQVFRGNAQLQVTFLGSNNVFLGSYLLNGGTSEAFGDTAWSTNISDFVYLWGFSTVPSNAVKAYIEVRVKRTRTTLATDLYVTQPYIGRATTIQTTPSPWVDSMPYISDANASTYIANVAINNAHIKNVSVDKITAGSLQTNSYIQSSNYAISNGKEGWKINYDGSATFNGVVISRNNIIASGTIELGESFAHTAVYVGYNGYIYSSTDDITFTTRKSSGSNLNYVIHRYNASISTYFSPTVDNFVAVGDSGSVFIGSASAATWTQKTSGTTENLNTALYNNTLGITYIAGNGGVIKYSTDDNTWDSCVTNTTNNINSSAYFGTDMYMVGDNGTILKRVDNINWQLLSSPSSANFSGIGSINFSDTTKNIGIIVSGSDNTILRTTDGTNWNIVTHSLPSFGFYTLAIFGSFFVASCKNGHMYRSSDGIVWTDISSAVSYHIKDFGVGVTKKFMGISAHSHYYYSNDLYYWYYGAISNLRSVVCRNLLRLTLEKSISGAPYEYGDSTFGPGRQPITNCYIGGPYYVNTGIPITAWSSGKDPLVAQAAPRNPGGLWYVGVNNNDPDYRVWGCTAEVIPFSNFDKTSTIHLKIYIQTAGMYKAERVGAGIQIDWNLYKVS